MDLVLIVLGVVLINLLASRLKSYPEWEQRFQVESSDWADDSSDVLSPNYKGNEHVWTDFLGGDSGVTDPATGLPYGQDDTTGFDTADNPFLPDWSSQDSSWHDDIGSGFSDHDSWGHSGSAFDDES